jgi:hypothetical protein
LHEAHRLRHAVLHLVTHGHVLLHYHLSNICLPSSQMVDYTLKSSCQANEAGWCAELHLGFYLCRTNLGVTV